jgi:hypothetical protein
MQERTVVKSLVGLLAIAVVVATASTDLIYIAVGVVFFVGCIAYAEWCEKL